MLHLDPSRLAQLLLYLLDASRVRAERGEALGQRRVTAPLREVAVADMDRDVLQEIRQSAYITYM